MEPAKRTRQVSPRCKNNCKKASNVPRKTSLPAPALKRKHQTVPIILNEADVIDHWERIRDDNNFSTDVDVARFLMSRYQDGKAAASSSPVNCGECGGPLVSYCEACNVTSTSPSQLPTIKKTQNATLNIKQEASENLPPKDTDTSENIHKESAHNLYQEDDEKFSDHVKINVTFETQVESNTEGRPWSFDSVINQGTSSLHSENKDAFPAAVDNNSVNSDVVSNDVDEDDAHDDMSSDSSCRDGDEDLDETWGPTNEQNVGRVKRKSGQEKFHLLCPFCRKEFSEDVAYGGASYSSHMKTHQDLIASEEGSMFRCLKCSWKFKRFCLILGHMGLQVGQDTCCVCKEAVHFRCELRQHEKLHSRENSQYCKWCGETKVELTRYDFKVHLRKHRERRDEVKGEHKRASEGPASRIAHQKAPVQAKKHMCAKCGACFDRPRSLAIHMARVHSNERVFVCKQPDCDRAFKTKLDLQSHCNMRHGEKHEVCERCGKKFHRLMDLELHMQDHTGKKLHCQYCPKRFKRPHTLTDHVNVVHRGFKPYSCSKCAKLFATKSATKKHETTHDDTRSFFCSECGMALKSTFSLEKHMLRHTNEKPFKCFDCGRCFRERSTFVYHRKVKHGDRVYVCQVCAATFPIPHSLAYHIKMCHNEVLFDVDKAVPVTVPGTDAGAVTTKKKTVNTKKKKSAVSMCVDDGSLL